MAENFEVPLPPNFVHPEEVEDDTLDERDELLKHLLERLKKVEQFAGDGFKAAGEEFEKQKKKLEEEAMKNRNSHFMSDKSSGLAGAKRIPCPRLGSNNPEIDQKVGVLQYQVWKKKAELWWLMCGVSKGEKLMLMVEALDGEAATVAMQKMDPATLSRDDGVCYLIEALREHYEGDFVSNSSRSVDAVLECLRGSMAMAKYIVKFRGAVALLNTVGMNTSEAFTSNIFLKNSGLDESQKATVLASVGRVMKLEPLMAAAAQLFPFRETSGYTLISEHHEYQEHQELNSYALYGKGYGKGKAGGKGKGVYGGKGNRFGKGGRGGPNEGSVCFKCGKPGHWARECTSSMAPREDTITCYKCGKTGHKIGACTMFTTGQEDEDAIVAITLLSDNGTQADSSQLAKLAQDSKMEGVLDVGSSHTVVGNKWLQSYEKAQGAVVKRGAPSKRRYHFGAGAPITSRETVYTS